MARCSDVLKAKVQAEPVSPPADIEAAFHRLLETDRQSREFALLWAEIDSYLEKELAAAKKASGAGAVA